MAPYVGLDDDLATFGAVVSQELATQIKQNVDYLQKSIPIGMICPIMVHITGISLPDPNYWQLCDGSEITNPNSPCRSTATTHRFTPNLTESFIRVFNATTAESGSFGGQNQTTAFSHNHSGNTGIHSPPEGAASNRNIYNVADHSHPIAADLTLDVDMQPPYYTVKYYMKIQ
jgi:hypothetical protein